MINIFIQSSKVLDFHIQTQFSEREILHNINETSDGWWVFSQKAAREFNAYFKYDKYMLVIIFLKSSNPT